MWNSHLTSGFQLNVPKLKHCSANPKWEKLMLLRRQGYMDWFGRIPLHDRVKDVIDIPNYYEFKTISCVTIVIR